MSMRYKYVSTQIASHILQEELDKYGESGFKLVYFGPLANTWFPAIFMKEMPDEAR